MFGFSRKPPFVAPRPEAKFCRECGTALGQNDTITSYDDQTGEPVRMFLNSKRCPNRWCRSRSGEWGW